MPALSGTNRRGCGFIGKVFFDLNFSVYLGAALDKFDELAEYEDKGFLH